MNSISLNPFISWRITFLTTDTGTSRDSHIFKMVKTRFNREKLKNFEWINILWIFFQIPFTFIEIDRQFIKLVESLEFRL